ncbi:MAG: nucleotide exchange factor GrpE [Verrucomicrobiae bacterium]|nr:nucleotide exchange factor GrpE [Verrucomicrobiae bacterium]
MKHTDPHSSHHHHDGDCCHHEHNAAEAAPVSPEPITPPPAAPQDPVEALQAEVNKYRDQSLRTAADLENYRKRMIREKEEAIRYANMGLLEKLIPILDNFELGLEVAKTAPDVSAASIVQGLSMVQRQLFDFVKEHGITAVEAIGQQFDPKLHEAIGHESHEQVPEGNVISQVRRGYKLADRLIRPAAVIVSKGNQVAG